MTGLIIKLIICPLTVYLSDLMFASVNYANFTQILIVGLVLAVSAHMMEVLLLKENTFWISNLMDFAAATGIVYFSQFFLHGSLVTLTGAILASFLLLITEYFQHRYLITANKVEK